MPIGKQTPPTAKRPSASRMKEIRDLRMANIYQAGEIRALRSANACLKAELTARQAMDAQLEMTIALQLEAFTKVCQEGEAALTKARRPADDRDAPDQGAMDRTVLQISHMAAAMADEPLARVLEEIDGQMQISGPFCALFKTDIQHLLENEGLTVKLYLCLGPDELAEMTEAEFRKALATAYYEVGLKIDRAGKS